MSDNNENKNISIVSISNEMETSFIDYAMSVIVSRAIPDVRDGLKPVHRRILYAMHALDMTHNKPFKKSARVVGEVIAKYHPHGDSAVYDSMVRLAQPFSLRYPLVWGQGNFGSIDGDSAAAMRYTEARLKKISLLLLDDIKKETVDFRENYDGSEIEPTVLPAKIPTLLLNGSTGIAVGMATSIPPHNLTEVLDAVIALAKNPELEIIDLSSYIQAPDFPTGGIIVNKNEMIASYLKGRGRAIVRGRTEIKDNTIIITEIPYMVNKSNLIQKIVDLVKNKHIESISDLRDESNRKGIRVVITLKKGVTPEVELNKLYKLSQLQTTFPINMLALVNDRPKVLNLKEILENYIEHQINCLIRKTKFNLERADNRKHILEGLHIALAHIDEVIELIKASSDSKTAIEKLMNKYDLSETQSKSILDMKLQRLTGLERDNLTEEIEKLDTIITEYRKILNSRDIQIERLITMFEEIKNDFGDERRTEVSDETIGEILDEDLIPKEEVVVTLTNNGYVKKIPVIQYRLQRRGGMGSKGVSIAEDDYVKEILVTNTHTDLLFFSSFGKVYRIRAHQIPQYGKAAKGIPVINLIGCEKGEKIMSVISMNDYENNSLMFVTKRGIVKRTDGIHFIRVNKNGKRAITLKDGDSLLGVASITNSKLETDVLLGNSNGKAIRFPALDIRSMGRTAAGVRGMKIDEGIIVAFSTSSETRKLVFSVSSKGFGKLTSVDKYRLIKRGGKGVATINTKLAGNLVGLTIVTGDEDVIIITDKGTTIRTSLKFINEKGRNTKGVKLVYLKEGENITSIAVISSEEEIEQKISETKQENSQNADVVESEVEEKILDNVKELTAEFKMDDDFEDGDN